MSEARNIMRRALALSPEIIQDDDVDRWGDLLQILGMTSQWKTPSAAQDSRFLTAGPPSGRCEV